MLRVFAGRLVVLAAVIAAGVLSCANAEDAEQQDWKADAFLGMNLTRGNSETFLAHTRVTAEKKCEPNELRVGIEGRYGETTVETDEGATENETNVQDARGYAECKHLFSERNYGYFKLEVTHDDIAGIDYRIIAGPGVGRYWIKDEKTRFSTELGVSYIGEKTGSESDGLVALRVAERFERTLSKTAKVWESAEFLPGADDFSRYLVNAEAGIEAAINSRLSLRFVASNRYDSDPADGKDRNDLSVTSGISVRIW